MRPLQAYDHLFTLTSVPENRTVTTDQQIWVWARPIGWAHTRSGCVAGVLGRACQCEQLVICLQSSRCVPWNTFSLVRFSWRWRVADVGFDSDKHAQTNGDMEKGGDRSMTRVRLSDV